MDINKLDLTKLDLEQMKAIKEQLGKSGLGDIKKNGKHHSCSNCGHIDINTFCVFIDIDC